MTTSVAGLSHSSSLFYVRDSISNMHFLVDTGAEVSIIPPTHMDRSRPYITFSLQAVDGSQIITYSVRSCTLNNGMCRTFRWVFIVANVTRGIIGVHFLHYLVLNIDIWHHTLADSTMSVVSYLTLPLALSDSHVFGRTQITPSHSVI